MGVDQITHVFIGRMCTQLEKENCYALLKDVKEQELCDIFNVEDACHFYSDDGHPIVAFTYGWGYSGDKVLNLAMDEFRWFVVAKYIRTIREETEESFTALSDLSDNRRQLDDRYKLIVIRDLC